MNSERKEPAPNAGLLAAGGTGVGLLSGTAFGSLENLRAIQTLREQQKALPELTRRVREFNKNTPGGNSRKVLRTIIDHPGVTKDLKYTAMQHAKDFRDRSRIAKTLPILKGRVMKNIGKRGLLGAGLGLGAGLLGTTALGSFD